MLGLGVLGLGVLGLGVLGLGIKFWVLDWLWAWVWVCELCVCGGCLYGASVDLLIGERVTYRCTRHFCRCESLLYIPIDVEI